MQEIISLRTKKCNGAQLPDMGGFLRRFCEGFRSSWHHLEFTCHYIITNSYADMKYKYLINSS